MPDEFGITVEMGEVEIVECVEEFLMRVPMLVNGEEIGDVIVASEDEGVD